MFLNRLRCWVFVPTGSLSPICSVLSVTKLRCRAYVGATFPPFVQNFLLEHCGPDVLLSSWALTSRQAGGAIEYDSKISTVFVGIIFGTRVKEVMSSPFIQNVLLEFGETSHYFCSKVASQG